MYYIPTNNVMKSYEDMHYDGSEVLSECVKSETVIRTTINPVKMGSNLSCVLPLILHLPACEPTSASTIPLTKFEDRRVIEVLRKCAVPKALPRQLASADFRSRRVTC